MMESPVDLATAEATVATNLLGPIRLTAAFLPHLRRAARSDRVDGLLRPCLRSDCDNADLLRD